MNSGPKIPKFPRFAQFGQVWNFLSFESQNLAITCMYIFLFVTYNTIIGLLFLFFPFLFSYWEHITPIGKLLCQRHGIILSRIFFPSYNKAIALSKWYSALIKKWYFASLSPPLFVFFTQSINVENSEQKLVMDSIIFSLVC